MQEVNDTVKFYYGITTEQYKHVLSILEADSKKRKKEMTVLAATNTAILALLFWITNHLK